MKHGTRGRSAASALVILLGLGLSLGLVGGASGACSADLQISVGINDSDSGPHVGDPDCWTLPVVTRARVFPRQGHAASLVGGKIVGSNLNPTNGFVDLAVIGGAPVEGQWLEIAIPTPAAYRYVKFYGALGSHGDVAELELYSAATSDGGDSKLPGAPYGTVPSDPTGDPAHAFDGDTGTYYDGATPDNQYVGLDLGAAHETALPVMDPLPGRFTAPTTVTMTTATAGAKILYTTDGSDPLGGQTYSAPITISATSVVNAVARHDCMLDSPVAHSLYSIGAPTKKIQSVMNIGNSLTGGVSDVVPMIASSGGYQLAPTLCVSAGAGTRTLWEGKCDVGVTDVKATLQSQPFDNVTLQPYAADICTPSVNGGEAQYCDDFYDLAKKENPTTQLWIFQTWPQPVATNWATVDCFSDGSNNDTPPWVPPHSATDWVTAMDNHRAYHEAVRDAVEQSRPGGVKPLIIPGGLALLAMKNEIEAGHVPGTTSFYPTAFGDNGTDAHLAPPGRYMVGLVMFACYFQHSPEGLGLADSGLTTAQALVYQKAAWQLVLDYPFAGAQ